MEFVLKKKGHYLSISSSFIKSLCMSQKSDSSWICQAHELRNERVEGVTRGEKGRYSLAHTLSVASKNTIASPGSEGPLNDIAENGKIRIQTSAEDRLFEKRARSEKFFRALMLCSKASNVRHVGAEQRRNACIRFVADT